MSFVMKRNQHYFVGKLEGKYAYKVIAPGLKGQSVWFIDIEYMSTLQQRHLRVSGRSSNKHDKSFCEVACSTSKQLRMLDKNSVIMQLPDYNEFKLHIRFQPTNVGSNNTLIFSITLGSCYESDCKSLSLKKLMDMGAFVDTVIKTNEEDIKCHKLVLAAESEYFRAMFASGLKESQENIVDWRGIFNAATVRDLLHYMYTRETPPNIKGTCIELVEASGFCLINHLKNQCVYTIIQIISVGNVINLVLLAEKLDLEELKEPLVDFLTKNYEIVIKTEAWEKLSPEMCKKLLVNTFSIVNAKKYAQFV